MNVPPQQSDTTARRFETLKVLREAIIVAVIGVVVALAANRLSPRGLSLTRNYFPKIKTAPPSVAATNSGPGEARTDPSEITAADSPVARLKSEGLQVVNLDDVKRLLRDPGFQERLIIFLDARVDEEYQAGHIPGAYQLDYYHQDKYIATVLPLIQSATNIVVYCNGGDCQDSEMTALMLRDGGVPNEKLFVYAGGIAEWGDSKEPIETGARNSGQMLRASK